MRADVAVVFRDVGDDGGVDSAHIAFDADVLDNRAFERRVAGAFTDAEQRAVQRVAAVQPGGCAVDKDFVEIVMAVPFETVGRERPLRESWQELFSGRFEAVPLPDTRRRNPSYRTGGF